MPVVYGEKERWVSRLTEDPDILRADKITLPRLSVKMLSMNRDEERQVNRLGTIYTIDGENKRLVNVPYILNMELGIWTRTEDEAHQIIEQILPFFVPDYNVGIRVGDKQFGKVDRVSIVLGSVTPEKDSEGGMIDETRTIRWAMDFEMKPYYYGPTRDNTPIRYIKANFEIEGLEGETPESDTTVYDLSSWTYASSETDSEPDAGEMKIELDGTDITIRIHKEDAAAADQEAALEELLFGWDLRINENISIEMTDITEKEEYFVIEGELLIGDINTLEIDTSYDLTYVEQLVVELNELEPQ